MTFRCIKNCNLFSVAQLVQFHSLSDGALFKCLCELETMANLWAMQCLQGCDWSESPTSFHLISFIINGNSPNTNEGNYLLNMGNHKLCLLLYLGKSLKSSLIQNNHISHRWLNHYYDSATTISFINVWVTALLFNVKETPFTSETNRENNSSVICSHPHDNIDWMWLPGDRSMSCIWSITS